MNWIKKHFKKLLIALGILGVALAGDLSITTENEAIDYIKNQQEIYLRVLGKYLFIPLADINISGKNVKYEVHEYKTPNGERGYQIFLEEKGANKIITKSFGFGVEAADRTWVKGINIKATTTP